MNLVHFIVLNKDGQVTWNTMFRTLFLVGVSSYDTILVCAYYLTLTVLKVSISKISFILQLYKLESFTSMKCSLPSNQYIRRWSKSTVNPLGQNIWLLTITFLVAGSPFIPARSILGTSPQSVQNTKLKIHDMALNIFKFRAKRNNTFNYKTHSWL